MSEPIIHAWWQKSDGLDVDFAITACGLRVYDDEPCSGTWKRANVTCPECLKTLAAAGVTV